MAIKADGPEENYSDPSGSEYSSDEDSDNGQNTPLTAPQTPQTPRPLELKVHHCPREGCNKSFNRASRLAEHERSHTGERIYKCKEEGCDKDFLRESHLKHHIKSQHTNERDFVCTWEGCDKSFVTSSRLKRHLDAHEGREKYRCRGYNGCNEIFRKHATLKRHIMTVHEKRKAFPCPDNNPKTGERCKMGFDTAEKLRQHQRAQHDPTRFSCSICLDKLLSIGLEAEEETLEAQNSNVYFATYSLLQSHIAEVHPPTCPECSKVVSTQRELRRHIEGVHGILSISEDGSITPGGDSHPCTYPGCTRTFKRKSNLNVHVNTVHKGERSFVCGETDLTDSKHVPMATDGNLDSCGRSFTSKHSLEEHVRTAHLGLQSKQVERKRKRKAEKEAVEEASHAVDGDGEYIPPKKKQKKASTRKTKTALSSLTGVREDVKGAIPSSTSSNTGQEDIVYFDGITTGPSTFEQTFPYEFYPDYTSYMSDPTNNPERYASLKADPIDNYYGDTMQTQPAFDAAMVSAPEIDPLLLLS